MQHIEMAPTPNSTNVNEASPSKGRGLVHQKKFKDNSQSSTPQSHAYHKTGGQLPKKGATTIPVSKANNKPRDINITGFSLQR